MPTMDKQTDLERLLDGVLASNKYRDISPDLVRSIGTQELQKRRSVKEALKATKNKLHQVAGAYLLPNGELSTNADTTYTQWLSDLHIATQTGNRVAIQQTSLQIMTNHASTKERLPILDQFYSTLFADLPPIHSVLDIACGLNPLALPWMPLAGDITYYAYDIYQHMMNFLSAYMQFMHIQGHAEARDVIQSCPTQTVDLALVLKVLPCLEQIDKQAAHTLLHTLNARHIIVSYPIHSLGGKNKGMAQYYEAHFHALLANQSWQVKRFEFATELVFILEK
jgi:16S rRNA (guanine(1405)-N(7))-methyltransferase